MGWRQGRERYPSWPATEDRYDIVSWLPSKELKQLVASKDDHVRELLLDIALESTGFARDHYLVAGWSLAGRSLVAR